MSLLHGFASKVRQFNVSFTPGLSLVIGGWEKFAKPFKGFVFFPDH